MSSSPHVVGDVMTRTVVAVGQDAPFKQIVQTMDEWKVSALPVLEGDSRVIGVISEADLLAKEGVRDSEPSLLEDYKRREELSRAGALIARDLMSTPVVNVHEDATLPEAARIMARKRIKRLPVVDAEGRLAGIVSRSDLLRVFLRTDEEIAREVEKQVLEPLFPDGRPTVRARVEEGMVTFTGHFRDTALVPVAARMARSVEGVVGVEFELAGPPVSQRTARPAVGPLH